MIGDSRFYRDMMSVFFTFTKKLHFVLNQKNISHQDKIFKLKIIEFDYEIQLQENYKKYISINLFPEECKISSDKYSENIDALIHIQYYYN
jgi:hypothetical protein